MRDEFVRRRGWLDDAAFVDLVGAANLIPGPTSTELAMHIGHRRAGAAGLVVAGLAFLLPAVVIVTVLAWLYVEQGSRPEVGAVLGGVAPVVVAIIAHAGWSIGRAAVRTGQAVVLLAGSVLAVLAGAPEIAVLLVAGIVSLALGSGLARPGGGAAGFGMLVASPGSLGGLAAFVGPLAAPLVTAATPFAVFGTFLKVGAVLFGSGYVLVALLRAELVEGLGWLTEGQLIDAIAIGQATPGPLFSTATFIGYVIAGPVGAAAATVGVFLPAFIAVAISIPLLDRLRRSRRARGFLDGVNVAAVGLLAVVAAQLAIASLQGPVAVATAAIAFILLVRGVGTVWLVAAGAAVGLIRSGLPPG
jgi:chromate transporter